MWRTMTVDERLQHLQTQIDAMKVATSAGFDVVERQRRDDAVQKHDEAYASAVSMRVVDEFTIPTPAPIYTIDTSMSTKLSNPKDIIGSDKMPFHLWPETA